MLRNELTAHPPDDAQVSTSVTEVETTTLWTKVRKAATNSESRNLAATVFTTLSVFGLYFVQGIVVARILGPIGRGEFGTALYFPRDIFLYAGLLGGIEIVNSLASKRSHDTVELKWAAARLGLISGIITAVIAALVSVGVLIRFEKEYLIPFCLIVCLFVPWEHMQLTISAVDRGTQKYRAYNWNRFIYASAFVLLVLATFGLDEFIATISSLPEWITRPASSWTGFNHLLPFSALTTMCVLFVIARVVGLLPTLRGMNVLGRLGQRGRTEKLGEELKVRRLLKQGRPYAFSMLASEVFDRLDIFLILALASVEMSGYYFVAVPAAALLTVGPNALGVFTFNIGADDRRVVTAKMAATAMVLTIAFQAVATLVFLLILPGLVLAFYGTAFEQAIPFAMWLLPACAIKGYLQAADGYLKGCSKPMVGIWARLISITIMLAFVAIAFPYWSLLSIPMAATVGQGVSMVIISIAIFFNVERSNVEVSQ